MFAYLKQDHKLMRENDFCPNFASVQITNFKHRTELSVIYPDQRDIIEQAAPNIWMRIFI